MLLEKIPTGKFETQVVHFIFALALIHLVDHTFRHTLPFLCFLLRLKGWSEEWLEVGYPDSTWSFPFHFWNGDLEDGRNGIQGPRRVLELYPKV